MKKPLIIFSFLVFSSLLFASNASAAILIDSSSSARTGSSQATNLTWTHAVSGSDRILIVGASINGSRTVSTVTYRGQNLTRLATVNNGTTARASLWYLLNPPTGSGSVVVTLSGAASFVVGATSYTGVSQTNPLGTPVVNSNAGVTATLNVVSATNELVVDVIARRGDLTTNPITAGSGQTQRWNTRTTVNSANTGMTGGGSSKAGAASVTMAWTWPTSRAWAIAGISLKPAIPPPDTTPPLRFSGLPSGVLPTTTTQTTISLSTNESATCRYSTSPNVSYGSMIYTFQTTGATSHSQLISGLLANNTYNFYVRCQDSAGNSNADDFLINFSVAPDTLAPSVPTNLSATPISTSQINLSWAASTDNVGVTGYRIYRCVGSSCTPSAQAGTSVTNFYSDIGLSSSTVYSYNITAYDAAGNVSGQSSVVSATTMTVPDITPPIISNSSPTGVLDIGTTQTIMSVTTNENATCRWSTVAGVDYGSMANGFSTTGSVIHSTNIFGLADGQSYTRYIRCQDTAGNANTSDYIISFSVASDTTAPSVPTNLSATAISISQINLSWDASTDNIGVTGYNIYRDGSLIDSTPVTASNYVNVGLSDSTTYTYTVSAFDVAGNESAQSISVSATTLTPPPIPDTLAPSVPTNLSATPISTSQINLSWAASTDNVGVTGYNIYRDGNLLDSTIATSYGDTELHDATTYTYTVSAFDAAGNESAQSSSASATTADATAPSVPVNLSATAVSISQINLSWDASTDNIGVTGYNIYRDGSLLLSVISANYSDSGLSDSTTYTYTVSAFDAAGNESAQSISVSATTLTPPPVDTAPPLRFNGLPSGTLSSGTTQTTISLSTDENAICKYSSVSEIDYMSMQNTFGTTGLTEHSKEIYNLNNGTVYNFYVRCADSSGNANNDDLVISFSVAEAVDITPPTIPANLGLTSISSTQVDFAWDASTDNVGVAGYKIFRDGVQVASTSETNYSGVGVISGTTYSYTVSAYDTSGNESLISSPLVVTTLSTDTTPPTIFNLLVSGVTTSGAVISWDTDEQSTSKVEYGLTVGYSFSTPFSTFQTTHTFALQNLSPNATYHYRVRSQDAAGNESVSIDNTFQTGAAPDVTPPNQITDLTITQVTYSSADLSWTAPSDETGTQVFSYDLRYSTSSITEGNWTNAIAVTGEPFPGVPGENRVYTAVGLTPDTTYYFAIKSSDASGNISLLSNIASTKTSVRFGGVSISFSASPSDFSVFPADGQILLQWKNPAASDFVRVVIIRKLGTAPTSQNDGETIYEGAGEEYTDINLNNDAVYYYAIYSFNREMNYSNLVTIKAQPQIGKNIQQSETKKGIIVKTGVAVAIDIFKANLSFGSSGEDVKKLQTFLAKDPAIYPEGLISGYFGSLTKKAVQKFQCKYKIVCNEKIFGFGMVGPLTRNKINSIISSETQGGATLETPPLFTQDLYLGIRNNEVKQLQEFLSKDASIYPEKRVTSYFGELTKVAVQKFQCKYNIACSGDEKIIGFGRVGPKTRAKLNSLIEVESTK